MPQPRVHILGPVEVWVGDQQAHLTKLERALVGILALERGRVVAAERLVDALWAGMPPTSAHGRVQSLVSSVRRTLLESGSDTEAIHTKAPGYALDLSGEQFDLARFEALATDGRAHADAGRVFEAAAALRDSLALWRGRALDGVAASSVVEMEAERLEELRLLVFEERVDAELASGHVKELIPDLRAELVASPTREHLRGQLMLALCRSGRSGEALQVYRAGYHVLREQLGIEPGPELRELHQQILEQDGSVTARRQQSAGRLTGRGQIASVPSGGHTPRSQPEVTGQPVPHPAVGAESPNQLPPQIRSLVGRDSEAAALLQALDKHQDISAAAPALIALSGMGGVGKTALALAVGHAARHSYPDGCLFADLRNCQLAPTDPTELIGSFLRALGMPPQAIPDDPDARLACYRSRTADRALLIVLDNARDERQIRPLIPASGAAAVLATSRTSLMGLDGAHLMRLDVLSLPAAVDLLKSLVGPERVDREPAAAERLAFLCGHLPLALRVVAARLAARTEMSLQDAVERLADEHRRLSDLAVGDVSVRSSLQLSYQRLSGPARALMRRMGLSPVSDYPEWLLKVLNGANDATDSAVLDQLVDAQLLDTSHCRWTGEVRYRTHDLVRLFCRERAREDDSEETRTAASRRVCLVLLQIANVANAELPVHAYPSVGRPLPSVAAPTAIRVARTSPVGWFEAEWPRLLGAVEESIDHGWLDIAWRLVASMTNFMELTSRLDEGLRLHKLTVGALTASARAGDTEVDQVAEAALLLGHARFLRVSERNVEAMRSLRRARLLFRRLGDLHGQSSAAISFGVAARSSGKPRLALAAFAYARQIAQDAIPICEGYALLGTGNVLMDYGGDLTEAARMIQRAVELLAACGDRRGEGNALGALASAYRRSGQPQVAVPLFQRAADVFTELADSFGLAATHQAWAELCADTEDTAQGRQLAHSALTIFLSMGHPWGEAMARRATGRLCLLDGDPHDAATHLERSLHMFRNLKAQVGEASSLFYLAQAQDVLGLRSVAVESAREAGRLYGRHDARQAARVGAWLADRAPGDVAADAVAPSPPSRKS